MSGRRKTKAKKNIITSLSYQLIILFCGIIVPRLMIGAFGSEAYGATSSITQFLAYITLLEGGIGGVARAVLYKPLAEDDFSAISAIMGEIKRFFRVIAWIFAGYVLILAFGFHAISHISCMDWISTFVLVVVISISTFGQYFIGISNTILLQAAQKTYITNLVSIAATVINAVSIVILIQLDCSIIIVKLVSSIIFFMRPVALWLYVRRLYPVNAAPATVRKTYLTQKWTGLGQHIAFFLHSNTDIAVLTVLVNLQTVAVYSVYNMIISHIQSLAMSFCSGMEAVFGDMLARREQQKLLETFSVYETIISMASCLLFSVSTVLIVPFIRLYTTGITDTNYIQPFFAVLMVLTALSYCLRLPYHSMVIAAGHFKQTRAAAYGEAALNIGLSVILVLNHGLIGVASATLIATWFRFFYYVGYLSRNIFYRRIQLFAKRFSVNAIVFGCNCVIGKEIISMLPVDSYLIWAFCGLILVVVMGCLTLGINCLFFRTECSLLLRKIIKS